MGNFSPSFGPISQHFSPFFGFLPILFSYHFSKIICLAYQQHSTTATTN